MKNQKLAEELNKWFNKQNSRNKNFWTQNPVAKIIKTNLDKWGNFRKKPKKWLDF